MTFTFTPKTEQQLSISFAEGTANYQILSAEECTSKADKPMIKFTLKIWDCENQEGSLFDYLVLDESKFAQRKIRHFCYSCGLGQSYEAGVLRAENCLNKSGKLELRIQKDKTGKYPDRIGVHDYVMDENNTQNINPTSSTEKLDDDIPF